MKNFKMSNLSSKVMAGLIMSFMGLLPNTGVKVSAMFDGPQTVQKSQEDEWIRSVKNVISEIFCNPLPADCTDITIEKAIAVPLNSMHCFDNNADKERLKKIFIDYVISQQSPEQQAQKEDCYISWSNAVDLSYVMQEAMYCRPNPLKLPLESIRKLVPLRI